MAEGKKSFILYADLIHTVKRMPHDKAGALFKTILEYVNDENPVLDDLLLEIAFEPIKQQLKRDLRKFEEFKVKQSENGKLGGRPKKGKPKNPSLFLKSQKSLNDNVNDSVNVNDKKEIHIPALDEFLNYCHEVFASLGKNFEDYKLSAELKYKTWVSDGWVDGNGKIIKNWKSKINNTIPYLAAHKKVEKAIQPYF